MLKVSIQFPPKQCNRVIQETVWEVKEMDGWKYPQKLVYYKDGFVLLLYVPSQQLWSWRDGQFT